MGDKTDFWTGIIVNPDYPCQPKPPFNGAGWSTRYVPQRRNPPTVFNGVEVQIRASSWVSAQTALDLIQGSHQLIRGDPDVLPIHLVAHTEKEPSWMEEDRRKQLIENTYNTPELALACAIAAKASRRRNWTYAVAKYKFSLGLYSVHHMDTEPYFSDHLPVSRSPADHVMFAHAIIAAYSVVEDLGLTLRASSKKPSQIGGGWNPDVKADLEQRLRDSDVDISEAVLWIARGRKRSLEEQRPIPAQSKAPWSAWVVRDSLVPVIDAIAYSEWLRSCVASHGVKTLTRVLSPYDVINVQHVARRLLLQTMGFWRCQEKQEARTTGGTVRRYRAAGSP